MGNSAIQRSRFDLRSIGHSYPSFGFLTKVAEVTILLAMRREQEILVGHESLLQQIELLSWTLVLLGCLDETEIDQSPLSTL